MLPVNKFFMRHCTVGQRLNIQKLLNEVTRVSTKVELRLDLSKAEWIPLVVRSKLHFQAKNSINKHGELVIVSEKTRVQHRNVDDALSKVKELLSEAAFVPKEPSDDAKARAQYLKDSANEKRLNEKRYKSIKKSDRKHIE